MKRKLFRIDNETRPSKTLKTSSKNESIETSKKSNDFNKILQSFEQLKIAENENKSMQKIELIEKNEENEEVILSYTSDEEETLSYTSSEIFSMKDVYDELDSEDVYVYTGSFDSSKESDNSKRRRNKRDRREYSKFSWDISKQESYERPKVKRYKRNEKEQ
jgi:Asp-tRNA(Asn)/Glu-tRNA(Gln) amidotransferase C subunit